MAEDTAQTSELIGLLRGLRAVRTFLPTPVPDAALADVLEVSRWTGSAKNIQPWELIVVRDRALMQSLASVKGNTAGHLATAPLGIMLVMDGEVEEHEIYDEGRLSERIMLAASAHGLGSCIGWFAGTASEDAKRLLGVPPGKRLRTVISIGYRDDAAHAARNRRAQPRKPLGAIAYQNRFGATE